MKTSALKSNVKVEKLFAPAKINLGLRITGERPDGYHNLLSLFVPLSVGDELSYETPAGGWEGSCDHRDVPMGPGSLVEKAFRFAAAALGYGGGLKVHLEKKIPMGAGLGGGSSDAAAVMRIVERMTGRGMPKDLYSEIAFKIGADVPFFLKDGPKWVEGIGEKVTPISSLPPLSVLLANPGVSIATSWVYSSFRQNLKLEELTGPKGAASLPHAFSSFEDLLQYVTNDLESVVLPHYPVVAEIKERLGALGADAALMSGSGSTVFGLYSDSEKRNKAAEDLKAKNPQWWVCACENLSA